MASTSRKAVRRQRVKRGVRKIVSGTEAVPRLSVFRSNKHMYAQLIDDVSGRTLAAACSKESDVKGDNRTAIAAAVGRQLAERASEAGINAAVFDRNGYRYHGRIKALAEGARKAGLKV